MQILKNNVNSILEFGGKFQNGIASILYIKSLKLQLWKCLPGGFSH